MDLKKKSVLFICPAFFGYEVSIKNALIANGYDVDFYDERPSNNSFYKAIFRVRKNLLNRAINKYYKQIIEKLKNKDYSFFLLIKGEVVPEWFIAEFKKYNPKGKLVYYTYDSFNNNNKHSMYILKHFDVCYSFDFEDVIKTPGLKLKHLFYSDEFSPSIGSVRGQEYDISFVGTMHSSRYSTIKSIFAHFSNTFGFFFMPAKWFFVVEKIRKPDYRKIKWDEISFNKLSKKQVADIFRNSKSVIDIQRTGQSGLTMRTFEVLASGNILVTTNLHIKQAEFYNENMIVIFDESDINQSISELKSKINNRLDHDMYPSFEKYRVDNWVKEFFAEIE